MGKIGCRVLHTMCTLACIKLMRRTFGLVMKFVFFPAMMPVKAEVPQKQSQFCSGARRSFFCRMKGADVITSSKTKRDIDIDSNCRRRRAGMEGYHLGYNCSAFQML